MANAKKLRSIAFAGAKCLGWSSFTLAIAPNVINKQRLDSLICDQTSFSVGKAKYNLDTFFYQH